MTDTDPETDMDTRRAAGRFVDSVIKSIGDDEGFQGRIKLLSLIKGDTSFEVIIKIRVIDAAEQMPGSLQVQ
jgi:hypothetical protein